MELAEQILRMISYLAMPFVAGGAAIIAWQQAKTNRHKLLLDGYDRRIQVYNQVKELLGSITRRGTATEQEIFKFAIAISEAEFLFGPEIVKYLNEIYSHAVDLARWSSEYRDYSQTQPPNYNHAEVVKNMHAEKDWLMRQYEPARQAFKKYFQVGQ